MDRMGMKNSHALVLKKEAGLKNSLKQIELGAKKCPRSRDIKSPLIFLFSSPVTIVLPTEVVGGDSKKLAPDRDG
jgi:hypothetical protein